MPLFVSSIKTSAGVSMTETAAGGPASSSSSKLVKFILSFYWILSDLVTVHCMTAWQAVKWIVGLWSPWLHKQFGNKGLLKVISDHKWQMDACGGTTYTRMGAYSGKYCYWNQKLPHHVLMIIHRNWHIIHYPATDFVTWYHHNMYSIQIVHITYHIYLTNGH